MDKESSAHRRPEHAGTGGSAGGTDNTESQRIGETVIHRSDDTGPDIPVSSHEADGEPGSVTSANGETLRLRPDNRLNRALTDTPDNEDDEAQDELYEHYNLTVDKGQAMLRIDKFLTNRLESTSRNRIQTAADSGNIIVNGKPVKGSYKVKPLDVVSIVLPYPRRQLEIIPENIPLDIVYEDDHLMVINKPAGMVVHPGHGNYSGTLVNALTFYLQGLELFSEGDMRAGLVHRIDKDTSGLLVIAKNEKVHARLARQFFDHTIERRYWALAWGNLPEDEGTITGHIGRSVRDRLKMHVYADGEAGKHAVTHYKVLKRYGYVTLVECRLETGRTHQIRVHMEWQGHPLFNDARYGGDRILKGTTFTKYKQFIQNCFTVMPRQALHAKSLGFEHPVTRERLHFDSPLAADFQQVLEKWDNYVAHRDTFEEDEVRENLSAVM